MNVQEVIPRTLTIPEWPRAERPREKLPDQGAQALSDAELLAVLLGSGTPGHTAVELARAHIAAFGSLRELLKMRLRCPFRHVGMLYVFT
ncbi:MAG: hypothetical protein JWM63_4709 [Gammaproteobacteria bacterium]|jgi:DNA repair protein RadC|nr:hypothetical protein [Gammaproteobacteria bacterium]